MGFISRSLLGVDRLLHRLAQPVLACGAAVAAATGVSQQRRAVAATGLGEVQGQETVQAAAERLKQCRKVVVMVGAGLSVNAGIPDFRTPGTGLYDNLEKYRLPYPEAIFDLTYFRRNPMAFYTLCKELWPGQYRPTLAHFFITLLHQRGLLQRCYTQNIDSLETEAGLPTDSVVAAHGNFDSATAVMTRRKVPLEEVKEAVFGGEAACRALNKRHGGPVKPDIVFFGENLPVRFFKLTPQDFAACDLLIVLGTSLQVEPFASLVSRVQPGVPRILINREKVGQEHGLLIGLPDTEDYFLQGDCDEGVRVLARALGLEDELLEVFKRACAAAPRSRL